jgi:predicted ATPase
MPRIKIQNFGPLKNVDLEIKDLLLFIGPQASGKSTIAKLIYFFKSIANPR